MLSRVQTQIHTEGALHMLARQNFFILLDTVSTLYREKTVPECKKQTNKHKLWNYLLERHLTQFFVVI